MEPGSTEGLRELVCLFLCGRDMLDGYELFGDMIVQRVMFEIMSFLCLVGTDRRATRIAAWLSMRSSIKVFCGGIEVT